MATLQRNTHKKESGQSLLEFSAGLIVLVVLFVGLVDLGRLFLNMMTLREAVQEGSLYGSMYPSYCAQIVDSTVQAAKNSLLGVADTQVTVLIDGVACGEATKTQACMGKEIRVRIEQPEFPITMPLMGTILGSQSIPLKTEISGTILRPLCNP